MIKIEVVDVEGRTLKLWPSDDSSVYLISDEGGWLDGRYDSKESAIEGFKLTFKPEGYKVIAELKKQINFARGENRLITMDDLRSVGNE